jgi:hypothetical protein
VEVFGHFEVKGDPQSDEIGEEVTRHAPRKSRARSHPPGHRAIRQDAEPDAAVLGEAEAFPGESAPLPRLQLVPSDRPPPPSSRPVAGLENAEDEGSPLVRWGVFLAVAGCAALAAWYSSLDEAPAPGADTQRVPTVVARANPTRGEPASSSRVAGQQSTLTSATEPATTTLPVEPDLPTATSAPAPSSEEDEELLSYEAYFVVKSSADAEVWVKGVSVGSTNAKNKVRCGEKFVRLAHKSPPPDRSPWLTRGVTVRIPCMKTHTISMDPEIEY